jgi:hypothetical protein
MLPLWQRGMEGDFKDICLFIIHKISPCPSFPKRGIMGWIKHGETEGGEVKRYKGTIDVPLSEKAETDGMGLGIPLENIFRIEQDYAALNVIEFWEKYQVVKLINGIIND